MNNEFFATGTQRRGGKKRIVSRLLPLCLCASIAVLFSTHYANAADGSGKILYQNDFSKGEVGKLPEDMLLLDGGFAVQEVSGNKMLQLPGAPLETYGVLFGPTEGSGLV